MAELARLSRLVYARGGADPEAVAAYRAAEAALDQDRRDLDEAFARSRPVRVHELPSPEAVSAEPTSLIAHSEPGSSRRPILVIGAIAIAIVGASVGAWIATTVSAPVAPRPAVTVIASAQPVPRLTSPAIAIFDRAQVTSGSESDLPPGYSDSLSEYSRASFRRLGDVSDLRAGDSAPVAATLFAARKGNDACLVVLHGKKLVTSECVDEEYFPVTGLDASFAVGGARYTISWIENGPLDGYSAGLN
ncbi:MAG TPA: hypothetical protein VGC41_11755 [Kofleriaceae bacterium]